MAVLALVLGLLTAGAASASLTAPSGLTPDRAIMQGNPALSWRPVAGATSYEVQVGTSPHLSTVTWKTSTVTTRVVPPVQLPIGQLWWRVRAQGPAGASAWTTVGFQRADVDGPTVPTSDATQLFAPPHQPAQLTWGQVGGATEYTLQISTDAAFVDPARITTYTTQSTSYVVPAPQLATTYHWRVRAGLARGVHTKWSAVRSYRMERLEQPQLISPANLTADADGDPDAVDDVVFDWTAVEGARSYDLQVSTDVNFSTLAADVRDIRGTRYSPPTTLRNDQYWWRVRATDTLGNRVDWDAAEVWTFRRHWPEQPELEYPGNNAVVGDPFFFQWTPVRLASEYVIEVHANSSFEPATATRRCVTTQTTFTPTAWRSNLAQCWPDAGGTYYWRVYAVDQPRAGALSQHFSSGAVTDRLSAQVHRFTYEPEMVEQLAPASGADVELPVLRWNPVEGAAQYRVTITPVGTGSATTITTAATTTTPRTALKTGTYRWQVQTIGEDGRVGVGLLTGSQPTFSIAAAPQASATTPEPLGADNDVAPSRFPLLTWEPVVDADRYRVWVRRAGTSAFTQLTGAAFGYPAGSDDGTTWIAPGSYEWRVEAWRGTTFITDSNTVGTFTVASLPAVAGHTTAQTGLALGAAETSCSRSLGGSSGERVCGDFPDTPVLRWTPSPDAGYYKIWLSLDGQMTNVVKGYPVETNQHAFTPTSALPDSQAGSAYYWHVQPCTAGGQCAPLRHPNHAFNKLSYPVEPLEAGIAATNVPGVPVPREADDVTLSWTDYLETVSNKTAHLTGVPGRTEARQYRVQVSTDPNFQSTLESVVVDQTTFTSFTRTYPEGPIYWRVQAIDGSGNNLTWSPTWTFVKRSSPPVLSELTTGTIAATGALLWHPRTFAASYDVEVYRNDDKIGVPVNLVYSGNSKQVAVSLPKPLPTGTTYRWRVRRVDVDGRKGDWSALSELNASFTSPGATLTLLSPSDGTRQPAAGAYFSWRPVLAAASYRFEREASNSSRGGEVVTTPATAHAPTRALIDGSHRWRVSALDAAGNVMGSSSWRTFTVDGTGPVATLVKPGRYPKPKARFVVRFNEPVTNVSGRTVTLAPSGRKKVKARVTLDSTRRVATLKPARRLKRGVSYTLTIRAGVRDAAGNPAKVTTFSFRVR